jgi:hypothetical protein
MSMHSALLRAISTGSTALASPPGQHRTDARMRHA